MIVIDSMIGSSRSTRRAAWIAALAFKRVEHRLDQDDLGAALDQRLDLLDIDVADSVSKSISR